MTIESRALSERSFISLDREPSENINGLDEILAGHNKTMFLLEKRNKALEELLEL